MSEKSVKVEREEDRQIPPHVAAQLLYIRTEIGVIKDALKTSGDVMQGLQQADTRMLEYFNSLIQQLADSHNALVQAVKQTNNVIQTLTQALADAGVLAEPQLKAAYEKLVAEAEERDAEEPKQEASNVANFIQNLNESEAN